MVGQNFISGFNRAGLFTPPMTESRIERAPTAELNVKDFDTPVVSETHKEMDMKMFQMMFHAVRMANESAPITINNIAASKAETAHTVSGSEGAGNIERGRPTMEIVADMFNTFFSSGFNRVCFFGACGMGLYIYWSYLDHKWHMAEVQRRIDSNIVLRTTQWLFDTPALKREVPASSLRLLPSFW